MLKWLSSWLGARPRKRDESEVSYPAVEAAANVATVETPEVRYKQRSVPAHIAVATGGARSSGATDLTRTDLQVANKNLLDYRIEKADTRELIRLMTKITPDLSASVYAYLRTAITSEFVAVARNLDGTFNREATSLLHQVLARIDLTQNYTEGAVGSWTLRRSAESLGRELIQYGSCSAELVLDEALLPLAIYPVSIIDVKFRVSGKKVKAYQEAGNDEINLDIPTFFYTSLDQDLQESYSDSPLEAAIQAVLADTDFFNDLRRIVKRALHPRMDVAIDYKKFLESVPDSIKHDPDELKKYVSERLTELQTLINGLNPEDALVHFDYLTLSYINHGTAQPAEQEAIIQDLSRARTLAGAKTLPSILGHSSGTQNVASTESMLFLKNVAGGVQAKIEEIFSQALTLAVRLFGYDVLVEFRYEPIDLRPKNELEAFKAMKQARVLELLSLGLITDDEACLQLTGRLTPDGYTPLTGTMFKLGGGEVAANPYSTTGSQGTKSGSLNQTLNSPAPKEPKS